jgi:hypothetical protein
MLRLAALVTLLALAPRAHAQATPQRCVPGAARADFGGIGPGSVVVPQRHRYVGGDPNWDPSMARFLGRVAAVTRRSGVDAQGCPGVRLDVDGGQHFWRIRDLNVGDGAPGEPAPRGTPIPEECGPEARYGPVRVGARVVLGRHRSISGDDNWIASMRAYVGRVATVVALVGGDDQGCAGVHVDVDRGEWFWRIRDMRMAEEGEGDAPIVAGGLAAEHGRAPGVLDPSAIVEACGFTDESAQYGPVRIGTEVVLGRHREVLGDDNWVVEMEPYVGQRARITQLVGVDDQGCPLVAVDVDGGNWFWRARDLRLP